MAKISLPFMSALLLAGCVDPSRSIKASHDIHIAATSPYTPKGESAIFAWPPYASAAVIDEKGNRCILTASGAKTATAKSELDVLAKILEKAELSVAAKQEIAERFTKVSTGDARSAFLDVALFNLCMLDQNGTFKLEEAHKSKMVLDAYLETVRVAAGIGSSEVADSLDAGADGNR